MKITREVNGVMMEFELDSQELFNAYEEQEHIWDKSYIHDNFCNDVRFDCMSNQECEEAYDDIAYDFRKTVDDMENPDQWKVACDALEEFFENYTPKNAWITVYKDALGYWDDEDNLTEILVPIDWLKDVLSKFGITDFEGWQGEYTADSTDGIARMAVEANVIFKCCDEEIAATLGLIKADVSVDGLIAEASDRVVDGTPGTAGKGEVERC